MLVTGFGVLCSAGVGPGALAGALTRGRDARPDPGPDVTRLYPERLPTRNAHALVDFDVRQVLGRKGTSFLDRRSGLALVACAEAIGDSGLVINDGNRTRIGIMLGTTWGSLKAMSDYTKETLVEQRPYLVNPGLFPNTVMNCAAGQAAIWYRVRGVNATIAGGRWPFCRDWSTAPMCFGEITRTRFSRVRLRSSSRTPPGSLRWRMHTDRMSSPVKLPRCSSWSGTGRLEPGAIPLTQRSSR